MSKTAEALAQFAAMPAVDWQQELQTVLIERGYPPSFITIDGLAYTDWRSDLTPEQVADMIARDNPQLAMFALQTVLMRELLAFFRSEAARATKPA